MPLVVLGRPVSAGRGPEHRLGWGMCHIRPPPKCFSEGLTLSLSQNYFQKLEKLAAAEEVQGDGPKKERTKLITPQVAKLEHTYKPGNGSLLPAAPLGVK